MSNPKVYDLFCGLGGWAEAFLAENYDVTGFDIEAHDYGTGGYPGKLILRDVRSIHGSELKDAAVIVASPPCQAYSYRAMPWKRAKALPPPDCTLFNECFRIQREASEAAGHYIPLIVENVRGAQKWVGRAVWNYGSFYLWGDVPALMPHTFKAAKSNPDGTAHPSGSWFAIADSKNRGQKGIPHRTTGHWTNPAENVRKVAMNFHEHEKTGKPERSFQSASIDDVKGFTPNGEPLGKNTLGRKFGSKGPQRKAASAMIAKIPYPLALHIARCYKPQLMEVCA